MPQARRGMNWAPFGFFATHKARTAANLDEPRSWRTGLAAEMKKDIQKLLTQ